MIGCGLHRVERLMREYGFRACPKRRPYQKWLADFTYIWTAEAWLYVAGVLDLFSRRIAGWSKKAERDAALVMHALMAMDRPSRQPP